MYAGEKALELGYGGIVEVSKATGLSRTTITKGIKELRGSEFNIQQIRKKGSGRKKVEETQANIKEELEKILDENTLGDPMSVLKWTCKTTRRISSELNFHFTPNGMQTTHSVLRTIRNELFSSSKQKNDWYRYSSG